MAGRWLRFNRHSTTNINCQPRLPARATCWSRLLWLQLSQGNAPPFPDACMHTVSDSQVTIQDSVRGISHIDPPPACMLPRQARQCPAHPLTNVNRAGVHTATTHASCCRWLSCRMGQCLHLVRLVPAPLIDPHLPARQAQQKYTPCERQRGRRSCGANFPWPPFPSPQITQLYCSLAQGASNPIQW